MSWIRKTMLIVAFVAPAVIAASPASAAAAPRHYDCSKPGNASKAACKGAAPAAKAPATPSRTTTTKSTATTTTKH